MSAQPSPDAGAQPSPDAGALPGRANGSCSRIVFFAPALSFARHHAECQPDPGRADILVAGIPCRPYSRARVTRMKQGSVEGHSDFPLFQHTLSIMDKAEPIIVVLENVVGWDAPVSSDAAPDDPTPMESAAQAIRNLGKYHVQPVQLGMTVWSHMARERTAGLNHLPCVTLYLQHYVIMFLVRPKALNLARSPT